MDWTITDFAKEQLAPGVVRDQRTTAGRVLGPRARAGSQSVGFHLPTKAPLIGAYAVAACKAAKRIFRVDSKQTHRGAALDLEVAGIRVHIASSTLGRTTGPLSPSY